MKEISSLMRDQMDHPLDRAIYWLEYVIRHKGAPHLRPTANRRTLYERGLLDVTFILIAVFLTSFAIFLYFSYLVVSKLQLGKRIVDSVKKNQ